jgi:peptidoglycan/xylan/chitin deacetylase (PgdA/CDA1 family)
MAKSFHTLPKRSSRKARCFSRTALKLRQSVACVSPIFLVFVALTSLSGCGGGAARVSGNPSTAAVITTISVSPNAASVLVGAAEQFQAIARDQHGNVMPGVNFDFSSSGSAATVDRTGLAKGMSAGTATITASAGGRSASASLTVAADPPSPPVLTQVSVSPSTASIQVGQQQNYTAIGYDQFNNVMSGVAFTWSSDGSNSIAIVNGNTATGVAAGTVHITASASGISSAPASLTVLPPPPALRTIVVTPSASSILIGATQQLTAVGYDQNGAAMSGITFAWSSSRQSVASVSSAGLAAGVAAGTAQITASAQGVNSNAVALTVSKPASVLTSISVSPSGAYIQAGSTQQFSAVGYDQYATAMSGISFAWSSSNTYVASITAVNSEGKTDGVAAGLAPGSTQITASASGVSTVVSLTVTPPPPPPPPPVVAAINVMSPNASINVGGTQQFSALATDQHGLAMSGVVFTWTSSDPAVATIDANGIAGGITTGTVQISASAQGVISNAVSLGVTAASCNCLLTISKLSPPMALAGSGDLVSLTITGSGFVSGALVNFGSNILTPSSVSPTSVVVTVPAAELTSVTPPNQPLGVSVTNPAPNAGTSGSLPFNITNHGLVSINFDDGYQSMYDYGLPILDAAGLKSTQYIITQKVGWDSYVTLDEVLQMHNNGHEIGLHTRTHQNLTTLTEAQMTDEIVGAKQDLISWGITPTTLAYPYGGYNPTVESVVQSAGLRGARDSDLGYNSSAVGLTFGGPLDHDTHPLALWSEAAEMDKNTTLSDITSEIDYAVANNLWLIILFHRVDETDPCCAPISVDHSLIQGTVDYLVQGHVPVVTNDEGLIIENLSAQDQSGLGLHRQDNTKH